MCFSPSATAKRACPECGAKQDVEATKCSECGFEFPDAFGAKKRRERECPECNASMPMTARKCTNCGHIFKPGGSRAGKGPSGPSGPR